MALPEHPPQEGSGPTARVYEVDQGQFLTPSQSSICLDQARHTEDDVCPQITLSDCKFNLANSFYTAFPNQLPLLFAHPVHSINFPCVERK